jgi:3-phenylpropionate/trans-cinnamate dioxygenase ferredoxin reductase component
MPSPATWIKATIESQTYESKRNAMPQRYIIVGANLAGGTAAITLREEGFDGEIELIGAEPHPPYERPPLSKEYLQGVKPFEDALLKPSSFYTEHNIHTRLGQRALHVYPSERTVELEDSSKVPYDKLLVATGVRNRRLRVPGVDLEGIYSLRTVDDADRIQAAARAGSRAVLVGMGFIGSEVAASLRHRGVEVVVIEPFKTPLYRVLGEEIGRVFADLHRENGVQMFFEESVTSFEGTDSVQRVMTGAGRLIECDFVVMGVGVEPVTDLLTGCGVKIDNGIVVDEYCQTNVEDIYAAGDVANHFHPLFGRHLRVEHWQNAIHQGRAAARSMLGKREPYSDVHWFWSDQYDCNVQYAGFHMGWDELVVRGNLEQRNAVVFYIQERRIAAAVAFNRGRDLQRAMSLIRARVEVEPEVLRDEGVDLRSLVPGARPVRTHQHRIVPRAVARPGEEVK